MKKVLAMVAFVMIGVIVYAFNDENRINVDQQSKKEVKSGEVIVMNKEMFIKDVFDYEKSEEWKYKGDKPAIIDLYADWCGPCRMTAPIMKSLAKEYDGKIGGFVQCNKHPSLRIYPHERRTSAFPWCGR